MSKSTKRTTKKETPVAEPEPVLETVTEPEPVETEVEEVSLKDQFEELIRCRQEDIARLRNEIASLKTMSKQYTTEKKNALKRRKRPVDPNAPKRVSGFAKPSEVSDQMYKFLAPLGVEKGCLISRIDVVKHINAYIKTHNLKNPEYGREFFPDKKLKTLFGEPLQLRDKEDPKSLFYSTMGIQTYLKAHFKKPTPTPTPTPAV